MVHTNWNVKQKVKQEMHSFIDLNATARVAAGIVNCETFELSDPFKKNLDIQGTSIFGGGIVEGYMTTLSDAFKKGIYDEGIREVPIAEKIVPFFEYWMQKDCDHLICTPDEEPFLYRNYYDSYWTPLMQQMNMKHRPHDTRHTCVSLLTEAKVDERIIKKIVGHKGQGVTQIVYTHVDLPYKLEAINLI